MFEQIEYIPPIIAAVSGVIGIAVKLSGSTKPWPQYILLGLIVLTSAIGIFTAKSKIEAAEKAKAYAAATGIIWDQPIDHSIFVVAINDDNVNEKAEIVDEKGQAIASYLPLTQWLFPKAVDGAKLGSLEILGSGLRQVRFELSGCGEELIVDEVSSELPTKRYFSDDYLEDATGALPCANAARLGRREDENGEPADLWVFDGVAGAVGHVINVTSSEKAGLVLSYAEQSPVIAELLIDNIADMSKFRSYFERLVSFELKFYQHLSGSSALADVCNSVYKIPLTSEIQEIDGQSIRVIVRTAKEGNFIKCELSPI